MASLISPGVSVTVIDESFYVPAGAATVPLIFVATASEKKQPNGVTPAQGTLESNVIRTVTSIQQSVQLYGVPRFLTDYAGRPHHGDVRNEIGLLALNQFLGLGSAAYVVRANVNLNDDIDDIVASWDERVRTASFVLTSRANAFLVEYNLARGYTIADFRYKTTLTRSEVLEFARQSTSDIWTEFNFRQASVDFFDNNMTPGTNTSGYQVVSVGGNAFNELVATGLDATKIYTATVRVDGVNRNIAITGGAATTFGQLIGELNADLGGAAVATLVSGNLKITSASVGSASTVLIDDATLFAALNGFDALLLPINGVVADSALPIYGNGYAQPKTGDYLGFEGILDEWVANALGDTPGKETEWDPTEAAETLVAAADEYKFTIEFLNKTSLGANDSARRVAVKQALQSVITSNQEIRSEKYEYNLIVCPGFPEVADEMLALNLDIGEEAFVLADTPINVSPEQVVDWGNSTDRYHGTNVGYWYAHPLSTNLDGAEVVGSSSCIALRTIAYNDSVAKPWMAPAGTNRGMVTNAAKVGYVTGTLGTPTTFVETSLNVGQRNMMYNFFVNINPITEITGRGILVMGQKTSSPTMSALDRINVVRLLCYIRRQLRKSAFAFLFEPNDQITRDNLKAMADSFLANVMAERGLYDFITVCDSSNNGADRIDRNELYLDIAIKPVKAVEFLYIPIRVLTTGAKMPK